MNSRHVEIVVYYQLNIYIWSILIYIYIYIYPEVIALIADRKKTHSLHTQNFIHSFLSHSHSFFVNIKHDIRGFYIIHIKAIHQQALDWLRVGLFKGLNSG